MLQVDWSEEAAHALRRMAEEASPAPAGPAYGKPIDDETVGLLPKAAATGHFSRGARHSPSLDASSNGVALQPTTSATNTHIFQRSLSDGTTQSVTSVATSYSYSINGARSDETIVLHSHGETIPAHNPNGLHHRSLSETGPDTGTNGGTLLNALQMINEAARSGYGAFHSHKPTATTNGASSGAASDGAADLAAAGLENDHDPDDTTEETDAFGSSNDPLRQ